MSGNIVATLRDTAQLSCIGVMGSAAVMPAWLRKELTAAADAIDERDAEIGCLRAAIHRLRNALDAYRGQVDQFGCHSAADALAAAPAPAAQPSAVVADLRAELSAAQATGAELRSALTEIERRLRTDTAWLLNCVSEHGCDEAKRQWKGSVYASAVHAQIALSAAPAPPAPAARQPLVTAESLAAECNAQAAKFGWTDRLTAPAAQPRAIPQPPGPSPFVETYLDQIDADRAAEALLQDMIPKNREAVFWSYDCINLEQRDGCLHVLKFRDRPIAAAIIVRDDHNRSQVLLWTREAHGAPEPQADAQDAARYRWLRDRDLDTISSGGVFAGMTPANVVLNGDDLDAEIDAAIAADAAKGA